MAKQQNVQFTGKVGNLVFYKRYGEYYIRTLPDRVKQSKATKKRSANFGIAAKTGAALRHQLIKVMPFPTDRKMQINLVGALAKWLKQSSLKDLEPAAIIPHVKNFQFNDKTTIAERLRVAITVTQTKDNLFELSIPSFAPSLFIIAPASTISFDCKIAIAGYNLKTGRTTGNYSVALNFPYNKEVIPAQIIPLPLQTNAGDLVVIGIAMEYNILKKGMIAKCINPSFIPSGIVEAVYC